MYFKNIKFCFKIQALKKVKTFNGVILLINLEFLPIRRLIVSNGCLKGAYLYSL